MSESESQLSAAAALREAAANLIAKADQLEASIAAVEDAPTRSTAFESLTTQFPDVDVAPLIDRFFRA